MNAYYVVLGVVGLLFVFVGYEVYENELELIHKVNFFIFHSLQKCYNLMPSSFICVTSLFMSLYKLSSLKFQVCFILNCGAEFYHVTLYSLMAIFKALNTLYVYKNVYWFYYLWNRHSICQKVMSLTRI